MVHGNSRTFDFSQLSAWLSVCMRARVCVSWGLGWMDCLLFLTFAVFCIFFFHCLSSYFTDLDHIVKSSLKPFTLNPHTSPDGEDYWQSSWHDMSSLAAGWAPLASHQSRPRRQDASPAICLQPASCKQQHQTSLWGPNSKRAQSLLGAVGATRDVNIVHKFDIIESLHRSFSRLPVGVFSFICLYLLLALVFLLFGGHLSIDQ